MACHAQVERLLATSPRANRIPVRYIHYCRNQGEN